MRSDLSRRCALRDALPGAPCCDPPCCVPNATQSAMSPTRGMAPPSPPKSKLQQWGTAEGGGASIGGGAQPAHALEQLRVRDLVVLHEELGSCGCCAASGPVNVGPAAAALLCVEVDRWAGTLETRGTRVGGVVAERPGAPALTLFIWANASLESWYRYCTLRAKMRERPRSRCPDMRNESGVWGFFSCSAKRRATKGVQSTASSRTDRATRTGRRPNVCLNDGLLGQLLVPVRGHPDLGQGALFGQEELHKDPPNNNNVTGTQAADHGKIPSQPGHGSNTLRSINTSCKPPGRGNGPASRTFWQVNSCSNRGRANVGVDRLRAQTGQSDEI